MEQAGLGAMRNRADGPGRRAFVGGLVVDPRPGANTIVGADIVAKSAPDGYTFPVTTSSTHTNNPSLYGKLPFDPAKDLVPVMPISLRPIVLVAQGQTPVGLTPEELARTLARETPIWAGLIQQSGARVE